MHEYYFEVNDTVKRLQDLPGNIIYTGRRYPAIYAYQANRIWSESAERVFFVKNLMDREKDLQTLNDEDLKEFVWIKLQAHNG